MGITPNLLDPRLRWQRQHCIGFVLNIGCEANCAGFGTYVYPDAVNLDIDKWEGIPNFIQADAANLPYPDLHFDTVVLGDVLEHCEDQQAVLREACRVAAQRVVITLPTDATPEAAGRHVTHVEHLKKLGLVEVAPGDLSIRHAHTREHGYDTTNMIALVDTVFKANGFEYRIEDTGARLPSSPAIGCVATRQ